MSALKIVEGQMLSEPVWLIIICLSERRWPIRRPLKDIKVWCHHLHFSAITSASKSWQWLWCNSFHFSPFSPLLELFASLSISIILSFICHHSDVTHLKKHDNQKTLKLNEGWQKRSKQFLLWTSIRTILSIGVSGCKGKDGNCIRRLIWPGGEQIEINELIKSKQTPRQTAH